jgi:hypothetical protein
MTGLSKRRQVAPGALHLGIALVALAVIAPLALSAASPAPPAIAEFAPQVQQIKQAPTQQAGGFGAGATPTPTPTPTPSASGSSAVAAGAMPTPSLPPGAIVSHCVGDPPRQTEDPQSPPCVPYWSGNNGGATAFGVTGDTITVAVPEFAFGDPTADADLVKFFNMRYQFYGRRLAMKGFASDLSAVPDPNKADAEAQTVQNLGAFASTGTGLRQGSEFLYYDDLARRHIISVSGGITARQTTSHYQSYAPYEWSFSPPIDLSLRNWGEFICKVLAGRPPVDAGGAQSSPPVRSFGELIERPADGSIPDDSLLLDALGNCGAGSVSRQRYEIDEAGDVSTQARNAIVSMEQAGVTSVICTCTVNDLNNTFMQDASSQGFEPEWVVQTYGGNDGEDSTGAATPDQKLHEIGISFQNKTQPKADAPWYWAVHEADPSYNVADTDGYGETNLYHMLLILAAGIQAAGPHLTPQTFAQGLQSLQFSNPGCGRAPYYQACVGFDGGAYTMVSSGTMIWHDPRQQGTVDASGHTAVCYVDAGLRYELGDWPIEPPRFYQGSCR